MNLAVGEGPPVPRVAGAMVVVALDDPLESRALVAALDEHGLEAAAVPAIEAAAARPAVVGVVVFEAACLESDPQRALAALEGAHGPEVRLVAVQGRDTAPLPAVLRGRIFAVSRPLELEGLSSLVRASLDAHGRALEVEQLSGELVAVARTRDEILSILSHELRAPLTPILGWTQVLRRGPLEPGKLHTALDVIERNTKRQAVVIAGLIDLTRAQQGLLEVELDEVDLHAVAFEQAVAAAEPARRQGLAFETREDPEAATTTPLLVRGDPARLSQIVEQLLSNAIKFTTRGGTVRMRVGARGERAFVEVSDTGVGIEAAELDDVFRAFRSAETGRGKRTTGLGTGLALARLLAHANGGTLEAASPGPGHGATFTLSLPRLVCELSEPPSRAGSASSVDP